MNKVTIKINGVEYNLKGRENEDYLVNIASYVDGKIKEIAGNNKTLSSTATATLASINIADELYKADIEIENLLKKNNILEEKNKELKKEMNGIKSEVEEVMFKKEREISELNEQIRLLNENNKYNSLINMEELSDKITLLEEENKKLAINNEDISNELNVKDIDLNSKDEEILELQNKYNKTLREKEILKLNNKDIKFKLQNFKYKVLDLEKKLIESNIKLTKEKRDKNPLLKI